MVTTLERFQQEAMEILEDSLLYGEPVILRTGLGNFVIMDENEYRGMMFAQEPSLAEMEDALKNLK